MLSWAVKDGGGGEAGITRLMIANDTDDFRPIECIQLQMGGAIGAGGAAGGTMLPGRHAVDHDRSVRTID